MNCFASRVVDKDTPYSLILSLLLLLFFLFLIWNLFMKLLSYAMSPGVLRFHWYEKLSIQLHYTAFWISIAYGGKNFLSKFWDNTAISALLWKYQKLPCLMFWKNFPTHWWGTLTFIFFFFFLLKFMDTI